MTRRLRRIHALLGVFFAPSIVFFSLTGSVQALGFHEQDVNPPAWVQHVAQVHKKQTWTLRKRRPPEAAAGGATAPSGATDASQATPPPPPRQPPPPKVAQQALRTFAALLGLGLATTAGLGIWMAWQAPRDRKLILALVIGGTLLPAALLAFA